MSGSPAVEDAGEAVRVTAGADGPRILIVRLLEACNAGCFMCDFAHSRDTYRFGVEDARAIAREVGPGTLRLVRFTGGEPLLHVWLPALLEAFAGAGLITSVITNGSRLAERRHELVAAGLAQVVVSLDGGRAAAHDRFRQTPGLFDAALAGLRALRAEAPDVRLRVNTVAGPHNIGELHELFELLASLDVDDWSIIPLKAVDGPWRYPRPDRALEAYREFQARVAERPGPRLLGFSREWMGRDDAEVEQYLNGGKPMTPRTPCRVTDLVRYYVPRSGVVYPCNCVPHRRAGVDLAVPWEVDGQGRPAGGRPATWLRENGPRLCRGCEPVNAALGEGVADIDSDPFAF